MRSRRLHPPALHPPEKLGPSKGSRRERSRKSRRNRRALQVAICVSSCLFLQEPPNNSLNPTPIRAAVKSSASAARVSSDVRLLSAEKSIGSRMPHPLVLPMATHVALTALLYALLTFARAPKIWGIGKGPAQTLGRA